MFGLPGHLNNSSLVRLAAGGLILVGIVRLVLTTSLTDFHNDFSHYYIGGSIFAAGDNPYSEPLENYCEPMGVPYDPTIPYAAHPPLILWLFSHLSIFSMPVGYMIWLGVQSLCILACLELTRRITEFHWKDSVWLIFVAVFLNSICAQKLIYFSQVQMLIGVLAYSALYAHLKGQRTLACVLITIASAFKIYPIVLAPWFFFAGSRGKGDYAKRFAAMAGAALVCLFLPGIQTWIDFSTLGVGTLADNALKWTNYSVQNFTILISRALAPHEAPQSYEAAARLLANIFSLTLFAASYTVVFVRRLPARESFCILLVSAVVGGIIAWTHYMSLMLLPVALLCRYACQLKSTSFTTSVVFVGLLVWMPRLDEVVVEWYGSVARVLFHFYPLLGTALIVILLLASFEYLTQRDDSQPALT